MREKGFIEKSEDITLVVAEGGLSNRLKCLISGMRIAEKTSSRLLLYWPYNDHFCCKFSNLFKNQIEEITPEAYQAFANAKKEYKNCRVVSSWRFQILPEDDLPEDFFHDLQDSAVGCIDLEFDRIPVPIRTDFLKYIRKICIADTIAQRVDEFSRKMGRNPVGLHIRTWSREMDVKYAERRFFFDLGLIYKMMDRIKNSAFYISTDSEEVLKHLQQRYGEKILHCPKKDTKEGQSTRNEEDALIDLLLLSKCNELKVSHTSTFGEMAWWLGGCSSKVEVIPIKKYAFKLIHLGWDWFGLYVFGKLYVRHKNARLIKLVKPISDIVKRLSRS